MQGPAVFFKCPPLGKLLIYSKAIWIYLEKTHQRHYLPDTAETVAAGTEPAQVQAQLGLNTDEGSQRNLPALRSCPQLTTACKAKLSFLQWSLTGISQSALIEALCPAVDANMKWINGVFVDFLSPSALFGYFFLSDWFLHVYYGFGFCSFMGFVCVCVFLVRVCLFCFVCLPNCFLKRKREKGPGVGWVGRLERGGDLEGIEGREPVIRIYWMKTNVSNNDDDKKRKRKKSFVFRISIYFYSGALQDKKIMGKTYDYSCIHNMPWESISEPTPSHRR